MSTTIISWRDFFSEIEKVCLCYEIEQWENNHDAQVDNKHVAQGLVRLVTDDNNELRKRLGEPRRDWSKEIARMKDASDATD